MGAGGHGGAALLAACGGGRLAAARSGTTSGYLQVRVLRGLWDTTYGQLLLVKITLVLPLLRWASTTTAARCRGCVTGSHRRPSRRGSCGRPAPSSR